jgi:hypothetical protein
MRTPTQCVCVHTQTHARMHASGRPHVTGGACARSYIIDDNVCYLTVTEASFPKHIAFSFLQAVREAFVAFLAKEHPDGCVCVCVFVRTRALVFVCTSCVCMCRVPPCAR